MREQEKNDGTINQHKPRPKLMVLFPGAQRGLYLWDMPHGWPHSTPTLLNADKKNWFRIISKVFCHFAANTCHFSLTGKPGP